MENHMHYTYNIKIKINFLKIFKLNKSLKNINYIN